MNFERKRLFLKEGQIPKGIEHRAFAENEYQVLLIEPKGVDNTGDTEGELTAENDV